MSRKKNKKETANVYDINNGITITDSISLTINSKYWINAKLLLIITALAGTIGFTFSFLSLFEFDCDRQLIYGVLAAVFLLCSVLFVLPPKVKLLLIPMYIFLAYRSYQTRTLLYIGYKEFINTIALKLKFIGEGQEYYPLDENVNPTEAVTYFLIILLIIITTIICYNTIVKPRFIFVFSVTFPFIETGLYFGYAPDHTPFFILIAYWVALFSMRIAGNQFHSTSGQPVFVRKRNIFVSSGNLKNNVIESIGVITLVSVCAIFLISSAMLKLFSYERSDKVKYMRYNMKTAISEMSFEKLINSFSENNFKAPVSSRSRLGNLSEISFKNRTELIVTIRTPVDSNLYIKGFTGSKYKNNYWYSLPDEVKNENKKIFDMFKNNNCFPQNFNYLHNTMLYNSETLYPPNTINVRSLFTENKYLFTPYGVKVDETMTPVDDSYLLAENMSEYNCTFINTPLLYKNMYIVDEAISNLGNNELFAQTESRYRDFVYENYLAVPDNSDIEYIKNTFASRLPRYDGTNITDIADGIKNILNESAVYSLSPGKTPSQTDLTYYLLVENHKGYCSHFATAASMLARLAGVPSRYVEGYVIVPEDFLDTKQPNGYRINIKDSRSHAWTEFYIDGYGWIPFEFTPGYNEGVISAELNNNNPDTSEQLTVTATEITTTPPVSDTDTTTTVTEAPVTTTPESESVSTSVVTSYVTTVSDPSDSPDKNKPSLPVSVKIILGLSFFIILVLIFILTRHAICIRKRMLGFKNKSINKSVSNVYRYTEALLIHYGISNTNMMPLEFAEYAEENAQDLCNSGEITDLIKLVLKSSFSAEAITQDELNDAIKTSSSIAENIYNSKNKYQQLIFKYILNLIK